MKTVEASTFTYYYSAALDVYFTWTRMLNWAGYHNNLAMVPNNPYYTGTSRVFDFQSWYRRINYFVCIKSFTAEYDQLARLCRFVHDVSTVAFPRSLRIDVILPVSLIMSGIIFLIRFPTHRRSEGYILRSITHASSHSKSTSDTKMISKSGIRTCGLL